MAPERVRQLIVLDLGDTACATRCLVEADERFLVKWYPLAIAPPRFKAVAGGVVHVPDRVQVDIDQPALAVDGDTCAYKDYADMLLVLFPPRCVPKSLTPLPRDAKVHGEDRLAVYWLAGQSQELDVRWSLRDEAGSVEQAAKIIRDEATLVRTPVPSFSLDDHEHYDLAISYASEDRPHVEAILNHLRGKRVFYDHEERAKTWGEELAPTLAEIYGRRSDYVLILASKSYAEKRWTQLELKAALARQVELERGYVLTVNVDGTQLEGIGTDVAFVEMTLGAERIAELILQKLAR